MNPVTGVSAAPHILGYGINLAWRNPPVEAGATSLLTGIRILRRERTFPLDEDDGTVVYDGPVLAQFSDRGLKPLTTYYYTVFARDNSVPPVYHADERSRASAFVTADYNLGERLYKLLPAVHRREDVLNPAEREQLEKLMPGVLERIASLPEGLRGGGPLRRFLHAAAAPLSAMRSTAEGLRQLYDLDRVPPQFLLPHAHWIGWETDRTLPVSAQRNEVRFAPTLYRSTGTVPNLRAIVTRYSGWDCQVAEFAQSIARSNMPPRLNVRAIAERGGEWVGADDAAPVLGFGGANTEARGSSTKPAALKGTVGQPFALRPGMELTISADGRLPALVRFQAGDFADITKASAAEVVAVLNRLLTDAKARAEKGGDNVTRVVLESNTTGGESALRVEKDAAGLVTLEGAPSGRLGLCLDQTDTSARVRLFYETADPLGPATEHAALRALDGASPTQNQAQPVAGIEAGTETRWLAPRPLGRIRYKTFRKGAWGESYALAAGGEPQGSPAAVQFKLPDGSKRIFLAWIDNPNTDTSSLRYTIGTTRVPRRARLSGHRNSPFNITPGTHLVFRGNWPEAETFQFAEEDFPPPQDLRAVAADKLAAVLGSRLNPSRITVEVQPTGTLAFSTKESGGHQVLELDLRLSTASAALGFDAGNAKAAGDWGDEIDWRSVVTYVPSATPGRHADLYATVGWDGVVWLFWATHTGGLWRVVSSRFNGTTWTPSETHAQGEGGNREPCAVLDAANRLWLFWSRRQGTGTPEDIWTLSYRVCASYSWGGEVAITKPPDGGGRSADREPCAVRLNDNTLRVFFRSDRAGGSDLWYTTQGTTTLEPVLPGPTADQAPAPLYFPDNTLWLLFRSDRSVSPARLLSRPLAPVENRVTSRASSGGRAAAGPGSPPLSLLINEGGTLRRYAGTTSVVLNDVARLKRRRLWDDLLAYTTQAPRGEELGRDDLYTRGTVGLFLSQAVEDSPLSRQTVERLRTVLDRFLPVNTRAVVILAPRVTTEFVYDETNVLGEVLLPDKYQAVEYYAGPAEDGGTPAPQLPGWQVIRSNTKAHVSAVLNSAGSSTWKLRTYYPPPK